jgi:hypothetical protein
MKFEHRDGADAPPLISLGPVRDKAEIVDGEFKVDDDRDDLDDVVERLTAAGHTPIDAEDRADSEQSPDSDADANSDTDEGPPPASAFSEDTLVELGYDDLRAIATQYDHINGNASQDSLVEALIEQRRDEVDE